MQYASSGKGASIVFELPQGMVDRGADIAFLSQYPHDRHEKEILARAEARTRASLAMPRQTG